MNGSSEIVENKCQQLPDVVQCIDGSSAQRTDVAAQHRKPNTEHKNQLHSHINIEQIWMNSLFVLQTQVWNSRKYVGLDSFALLHVHIVQ